MVLQALSEHWFSALVAVSHMLLLIAWLHRRHQALATPFGSAWSGWLRVDSASGGDVYWRDEDTCVVRSWSDDFMLTLESGCMAGYLPLVQIEVEGGTKTPVSLQAPFLDDDEYCIMFRASFLGRDDVLQVHIDDGHGRTHDFRIIRVAHADDAIT